MSSYKSKSLAGLRATPYKIPKGSVSIDLTCGHSAWYVRPAPAPGCDAYCRDCGSWTRRKRESKSKSAGAQEAPASAIVIRLGRKSHDLQRH